MDDVAVIVMPLITVRASVEPEPIVMSATEIALVVSILTVTADAGMTTLSPGPGTDPVDQLAALLQEPEVPVFQVTSAASAGAAGRRVRTAATARRKKRSVLIGLLSIGLSPCTTLTFR
jgi:hypothetical protein